MKTIKEIIKILESAVANVQRNEQIINDLNVFPVPDGDTGSNMLSTLLSGINEVKNNMDKINSEIDILEHFSRGCLYGARGNSGVITSQIMKGLYEGSKDHGLENKNVELVKIILSAMKDYGYKSVPKPVEGTILSVIKYTAENFNLVSPNSVEIMDEVVKLSEIALENTPNQLDVLKKAGVVDSGGKGLVAFFEGVREYFLGKPLKIQKSSKTKADDAFIKADPNENIGYCSEFIMTLKDPEGFNYDKFNDTLESMGDSIVLIKEDDILKVHVHVKDPGSLLTLSQTYGEFSKIKIENMTTQVSENPMATEFAKGHSKEEQLGMISVANGVGIEKIMKKYKVDIIINGGQTMNPSVNDFIQAITLISNKEIVLFPNNSNIILAAEKAKEMAKEKFPNKIIHVLPTRSIQHGLYSIFNMTKEFVPFEDFMPDMIEELKELSYGEITYATRDTNMEGVEIKEGQYLTIAQDKIISSTDELHDAVEKLLDNVISPTSDIVNVLYNNEVEKKTLKFIKDYVDKKFSDVELKLMKGDQKVYFLMAFGE